MLQYTDDSLAAMLLTVPLSPDREEYAKPFSTSEFRALEARVKASRFGSLRNLIEVDVSGVMIYLEITEPEAMRIYTLLNRQVQLMYLLETFDLQGIEAVSCYDDAYPRRVLRKLDRNAPVFYYRSGNPALAESKAVAILGVRGVRTSNAVRKTVAALVREVTARGYTVVTGGEPGVSRVAADQVAACGGRLLEVLGGNLSQRVAQPEFAALGDHVAAMSLEHPDALFTSTHAANRNKLLMSLADAAFIFSADGRRGEAELAQSRLCDWVYVWDARPENQGLINRGAIPFHDISHWDFDALSRHWSSSDSEQLNIFDLL